VKRFVSLGGVVFLCLALAGCGYPRGAWFETEVLAGSVSPTGEVTQDFAVEAVTKAELARFAAWPQNGPPQRRWINRQPQNANRIIAPGDMVSVVVWSTEENSLLTTPGQRSVELQEITVSSSGTIFLPYVSNVRIAGMSPDHAREVIQEKFVSILPSAQVQLELTEGRQSTVSVVSGVDNPGPYPLPDQDFTVLALLAAAGGVDGSLDNPQIRLIRDDVIYGTSINRLFAEPQLDTTLQGGDKVIVEEDDRFFLSLGAAGRQASFPFTRDSLTALDALAIVGGIDQTRANPQGILILRQYPASAVRTDGTGPRHTRTVFTLDLTTADGLFSAGQFQVNSGDLVYATESPVSSTRSLIAILAAGIGLAAALQ
jgi:polysaccharide export outer membrane protein